MDDTSSVHNLNGGLRVHANACNVPVCVRECTGVVVDVVYHQQNTMVNNDIVELNAKETHQRNCRDSQRHCRLKTSLPNLHLHPLKSTVVCVNYDLILTQSQVEYNIVGTEYGVDVAVGVREVCSRSALQYSISNLLYCLQTRSSPSYQCLLSQHRSRHQRGRCCRSVTRTTL